MTREEAIRQLDGADIAVLNRDFFKFNQAIIMAISALRQQETVTNRNGLNEPLTLDDLRDMPCEPVYIVVGCASWWDIVSYAGMEYLYLKVEGSLPFRDYGKNWTAYRQKPEEGTDR